MNHKPINKVFKQVLKAFAKEVLKANDNLIEAIDDCETYEELKDMFEDWSSDIFKIIGGECSKCEEKDDEIDELQRENSDLETEIDELKDAVNELDENLSIAYFPKNICDLYKLEAFKRNVDRFSVSEIESLLD